MIDKEIEPNDLYTLEDAARALGVSRVTLKKWMAQENIQKIRLETDKRGVYISHDDFLALANKHRPLSQEQEKRPREFVGLYSLTDVQRLLGVKKATIERWLAETDIERKLIVTDKKRVYLSYSDILVLSEKYNHPIDYSKAIAGQDNPPQDETHAQDEQQTEGKKFYTIAEASQFLGVAESTVRNWLSLYHIETQTDDNRSYIAYSDVVLMANKQSRERAYPVNITTDIRAIRYRLDKIEADILNLEKYIKRSVYLGRSTKQAPGPSRQESAEK